MVRYWIIGKKGLAILCGCILLLITLGAMGARKIAVDVSAQLKTLPIYSVETENQEKKLALGINCAWGNEDIPAILKILEEEKIKATFFVVGHFLESAPDIVKRMTEEGHAVGNHTYHHPDMSSISELASFQKEIDDVASLYQSITGKEMIKYYRPPQGKYSTENLKMAKELGYNTFFWSLAYVDWIQDQQPTKEAAFDKLLKRIHPGAVVLLHSTSSTNAQILDELLTKWEEMGYHFAPLSELAEKI